MEIVILALLYVTTIVFAVKMLGKQDRKIIKQNKEINQYKEVLMNMKADIDSLHDLRWKDAVEIDKLKTLIEVKDNLMETRNGHLHKLSLENMELRGILDMLAEAEVAALYPEEVHE